MSTRIRTYSELSRIPSFLERFEYLSLRGVVGDATFGSDRWINQRFYGSHQWRKLRDEVIVRDLGCDLGVEGYEIHTRLIVHHMNPVQQADIVNGTERALNPEYLICTTHVTHNAIHYGDVTLLDTPYVPRSAGDTKLW